MQPLNHAIREAANPFDRDLLSGWLREHLAGFSGLRNIVKFPGGQSNPTYKLVTDRTSYVMRCKPAPMAQLLPTAHAIEREYRVMAGLAATDVPVPRVHCLCEDESVIGRAFYIMDCMEGRVMWNQALPDVDPGNRTAIYQEMNRIIALLHSVDPAAVGLDGFGRPNGYMQRQISRWTNQFRACETENQPAMERLIEWLPEHIPPGEEAAIVHGDFRIDNMIFANDRPRVIAILDWELSTLGHPLADFSYHCLSWHLPSQQFRGLSDLNPAVDGIPSEREYIAQYCERTGRSMAEVLSHWNFYLAFNLFRLAGIAQGIVKRALEGTASHARAIDNRQLVEPLAAAGWAAAARTG